jgi:hypothetical protein
MDCAKKISDIASLGLSSIHLLIAAPTPALAPAPAPFYLPQTWKKFYRKKIMAAEKVL